MPYQMTRTMVFKNAAAMAAAMPVCKEVVQYLSEQMGIDAHLEVPVWSGPVNRTAVVTKIESLDAAQERTAKAMTDPKYLELLKRLGEYIDGTQTHDQLWRVVR